RARGGGGAAGAADGGVPGAGAGRARGGGGVRRRGGGGGRGDGVGAGVAGSPGVDAGVRAGAEGGGVAIEHGLVARSHRCKGTGPLRLGSESACTSRTMRSSRSSRVRCPYVAAKAL